MERAPGKPEEAPIEIRAVTPEDYRGAMEVLYRAQLESYPNEALGITRDDIEAGFENQFTEESIRTGEERWRNYPENPNELYLIATQGNKVIGRCIVNRYPDHNQLDDIYIDPESQGKGLGRKFWEQAQDFIDPSKETVVMVLPYNERAIGFYERIGFVKDEYMNHEVEGTVMESGAIMPAPIKMVLKTARSDNS
jgi:ribosomal protein S18 acetylase RimI-like enzyme